MSGSTLCAPRQIHLPRIGAFADTYAATDPAAMKILLTDWEG